MTLLERTQMLLDAVDDLSTLTMNPSIFSDDLEKHDCDSCPASSRNAGDLYDEGVCRRCWSDAIKESGHNDQVEARRK
jgi:hypothetical protein